MRGKVSDMHSGLTVDLVREFYNYDSATGNIKRRVGRGTRWYKGEIVGTVGKNGYRYIGINRKLYLAHRVAWLIYHGRWPVADIDHINGDKDDNRMANLREATRSENNINSITPRNNTSGHKGCYYDKRRSCWYAEIWVNKKKIFLGRFDSSQEAGEAYQAAAQKYYGEFARSA